MHKARYITIASSWCTASDGAAISLRICLRLSFFDKEADAMAISAWAGFRITIGNATPQPRWRTEMRYRVRPSPLPPRGGASCGDPSSDRRMLGAPPDIFDSPVPPMRRLTDVWCFISLSSTFVQSISGSQRRARRCNQMPVMPRLCVNFARLTRAHLYTNGSLVEGRRGGAKLDLFARGYLLNREERRQRALPAIHSVSSG